jgi:ATP-dependent Clp protease protease subunit
MATLKIYNDIQSEEDKAMSYYFGTPEGVCFKDVDTFCASMQPDDNTIDVRIFCDGGRVDEGWAIYDRLRATGKEIWTTIEGKAASMATIIMLAAPREHRRAYRNARILVHNPFVVPQDECLTADRLAQLESSMRAEQERIVNLYVERCGCNREEIQALMNEDKYITAERAMELGFIGSLIEPASAKATDNNIINHINESEKMDKVEVKKNWLQRLLAKAGFGVVEDTDALPVLDMELHTATGATLTIEREEGAPQVGDKAQPNGEHPMPDGSVIVVEDGVIVEIREKVEQVEGEPTADKTEDTKKGEASAEDVDTASLDAEINDLKAENAALRAKVEELTKELDTAKANAKSNDDLRILNAVKMAGGEKALAQFASHFVPEARKPQTDRVKDEASKKSVSKDDILAKLSSYKKK